jgi:phosphoglycolate phosphatase-like HAD superfamily hydrolase
MVGDTEADILAAKRHGVKVIGVLCTDSRLPMADATLRYRHCPLGNRAQLERYAPDIIVNNLGEAVDLVFRQPVERVG